MVYDKIIRAIFCCVVIFASNVFSADVSSRGETGDRVGARCVICCLDPSVDKAPQVVWCNGPAYIAKVYASVLDAAAHEVGGHCVHLGCLKLHLLRFNNRCPLCNKGYSLEERASILDSYFELRIEDGHEGGDECEPTE